MGFRLGAAGVEPERGVLVGHQGSVGTDPKHPAVESDEAAVYPMKQAGE
ncbi:hypothetical protein FrEUN1fDRAFT_6472 [Parafrankia sp. EUN1f]|nr:hypothetical protein FrEUN1fDRAFT_6472 [Parafrankia sp. EUN1f]